MIQLNEAIPIHMSNKLNLSKSMLVPGGHLVPIERAAEINTHNQTSVMRISLTNSIVNSFLDVNFFDNHGMRYRSTRVMDPTAAINDRYTEQVEAA